MDVELSRDRSEYQADQPSLMRTIEAEAFFGDGPSTGQDRQSTCELYDLFLLPFVPLTY